MRLCDIQKLQGEMLSFGLFKDKDGTIWQREGGYDGEPIYWVKRNRTTVRRLTPTECERLQGFPDSWTKYGIDEKGEEVLISDTQRYKMCGNAVTVNVIEAIVREWTR
ncbi:unnamed protein product [marine sediment metagenome]|uniref:DNA (cytosine-5-)-methyltransferase n=1 Tax=marine sediment metagenome TaxID=412755 RepID=X0W1K5_9ZZZZ